MPFDGTEHFRKQPGEMTRLEKLLRIECLLVTITNEEQKEWDTCLWGRMRQDEELGFDPEVAGYFALRQQKIVNIVAPGGRGNNLVNRAANQVGKFLGVRNVKTLVGAQKTEVKLRRVRALIEKERAKQLVTA